MVILTKEQCTTERHPTLFKPYIWGYKMTAYGHVHEKSRISYWYIVAKSTGFRTMGKYSFKWTIISRHFQPYRGECFRASLVCLVFAWCATSSTPGTIDNLHTANSIDVLHLISRFITYQLWMYCVCSQRRVFSWSVSPSMLATHGLRWLQKPCFSVRAEMTITLTVFPWLRQ